MDSSAWIHLAFILVLGAFGVGLYLAGSALHRRDRAVAYAEVVQSKALLTVERIMGTQTGAPREGDFDRVLRAGILLRQAEDLCTRPPNLGETLLLAASLGPLQQVRPLVDHARTLLGGGGPGIESTAPDPPADRRPASPRGLVLLWFSVLVAVIVLGYLVLGSSIGDRTATQGDGALVQSLNSLMHVAQPMGIPLLFFALYMGLFLAVRWTCLSGCSYRPAWLCRTAHTPLWGCKEMTRGHESSKRRAQGKYYPSRIRFRREDRSYV